MKIISGSGARWLLVFLCSLCICLLIAIFTTGKLLIITSALLFGIWSSYPFKSYAALPRNFVITRLIIGFAALVFVVIQLYSAEWYIDAIKRTSVFFVLFAAVPSVVQLGAHYYHRYAHRSLPEQDQGAV